MWATGFAQFAGGEAIQATSSAENVARLSAWSAAEEDPQTCPHDVIPGTESERSCRGLKLCSCASLRRITENSKIGGRWNLCDPQDEDFHPHVCPPPGSRLARPKGVESLFSRFLSPPQCELCGLPSICRREGSDGALHRHDGETLRNSVEDIFWYKINFCKPTIDL